MFLSGVISVRFRIQQLRMVPIRKINWHPDQEYVNQKGVERYKQMIKEGKELPPITLVKNAPYFPKNKYFISILVFCWQL